MFSQFERQYSDYLRNHLVDLNIKENRSSESRILSHINSHLQSCSSNTTFTPTLTKSCKSDELARAHVAFAVELVERNGFVLALAELCEAIKNSTSTESLVLVIATRIIVLFKLKLLHELRSDLRLLKAICCKSCFKSIFHPNSDNERKTKDLDKCTEQFQPIASKFEPIEQCPLTKPNRKKLRGIHESLLEETPTQSHSAHNPPRQCTLPSLLTPTVLSEEYNFVTSKFRIDQSTERGRYVVAEQDLHVGEVLAVEEPSVWTVLPQRWSSHCQLCLNVCRAPLPCLRCPDVVFCSVDCLTRDIVHQMECGYMPELQSLPKMVYLAFRTVLKYRKEIVLHSRNKDTSQSFEQLMNLITNLELRSPVDLIRRTTLAIFLSNVIRTLPVFTTCNKYSFINRPDREQRGEAERAGCEEGGGVREGNSLCSRVSVGEVDICMGGCVQSSLELSGIYDSVQTVLLKCLQSYPCNAHEISELQIAKQLRFSVNEDIGAGAFPFLSLLNHSCNPNVVRHSVGRRTVLRALREIRAGQEILDNYGYHYATHTLPERKRALRTQYLFTCSCAPCADRKSWPTFDDVPTRVTIRCSRCNSPLLTKRTICETCGKNATKPFQRMDWLATETNQFIHRFITDGEPGSSSAVFEFLKMCEMHAELPFRLHNESQEVVKQIWNLQSNSNKPLS